MCEEEEEGAFSVGRERGEGAGEESRKGGNEKIGRSEAEGTEPLKQPRWVVMIGIRRTSACGGIVLSVGEEGGWR